MITKLRVTFLSLLVLLAGLEHAVARIPGQTPSAKSDSMVCQKLMSSSYLYLNKPGSDPVDLNQAKLLAEKAMNFSKEHNKIIWQADVYLLQSSIARESGNNKLAASLMRSAEKIYESSSEWRRWGNALMEKRLLYGIDGKELDERIIIIEKAVSLSVKSKDKLLQADALKELGDLLQIRGDFPRALVVLKESLSLYLQTNYKKLQGIYDLLGLVSTTLGMNKEGLEYGLEAVKTAEAVGDSTMQLCTIYNRIASTYVGLEDYINGYNYYQKSMNIARRYHDNQTIIQLTHSIGALIYRGLIPGMKLSPKYFLNRLKNSKSMSQQEIFSIMGILVNICDRLNQDEKAQKYFEVMSTIMEKEQLSGFQRMIYYQYGAQHFLHRKELKKAEYFIDKFRSLSAKAGAKHNSILSERLMFRLDSLRGDYMGAIRHYQRYQAAKDSMNKKQNQDQVAMLNVRFNMEKKDHELKSRAENIDLLTKRGLLQQQLLEKTQLNRNITAVILVLSVLLLILLFKGYVVKQKNSLIIGQTNERLRKLVEEKSWLVREIHHRVKNNLQIVISLLNIQSANMQSDPALKAIKESQSRMYAMSLIHQKLYMTDERTSINMKDYIHELSSYLKDSFELDKRIVFETTAEDIELDVSEAVPIGLIMNEAITNAIKYAFPEQRSGRISIIFQHLENAFVSLIISDNGIGMPVESDWHHSESTGISLISMLTSQIDAELKIYSENGLTISVQFKPS